MRASSRASGAPRQWWMPWPKARWGWSVRVRSSAWGWGVQAGWRLAASRLGVTISPAGMVVPPMSMGSVLRRRWLICRGPSKRSSSSMAVLMW